MISNYTLWYIDMANWTDPQFSMGESTQWPCSIAMLNYQKVVVYCMSMVNYFDVLSGKILISAL